MSTTTPIAPNPYTRYSRPRSLFGPIFLIAIGVLFLLRSMGLISFRAFWPWFAHYWPVLLILWGAITLVEHLLARRQGRPAPRMGAGAVVLVIFFVAFGSTTTHMARVNWGDVRDNLDIDADPDLDNIFGSIMGTKYDFTDNFAEPFKDGSQIKVLGGRGDIKVTPSNDGQVHVIVQKTVRSESKSDADKMNESSKAKFQQQGSLMVLDLSGAAFDRGRFNVEMEVPRSAPVNLFTHHGAINISDRDASVDAFTEHGDIELDTIKGDASIHVKHGNVTANKVGGNVTIDGVVNDASVSDLAGSLSMTGTYYGSTKLERIAKPVRFNTSRTDLQFARLDGEFNMEPEELRASQIVGPFRLDTRSKGVHLDQIKGDVHIGNRNATIEISSTLPLGTIDVSNVHGDIQLTVPPDAAFQLDAESLGGEVSSDFGKQSENNNRATATGVVGKGGPQVRLRTDHATIRVSKQ
jgi:DUF4097 and DUF4098 domain-containing protein YvlB